MLQLASHVISMLAARKQVDVAEMRRAVLARLIEALVSDDPMAAARLLEEMRRQRIPAESLIDDILPEAARSLGAAWDRDQISFVDVTIGSMRLQGMLRDIEMRTAQDIAPQAGAGSVLVIVPSDEQHTLGALVISNRMRRMGVSVCLRIMPGTNLLRDLLANRNFDAVMLSVSASENLDLASKVVKLVRQGTQAGRMRAPPVIVGGALVAAGADVGARIEADLATCDLEEALRFSGLDVDGLGLRQRA